MKRRTTQVREGRAPLARGGVSFGAILTGVVVAFGAMFLLSALVAGMLVATGTDLAELSQDDVVSVGVAAGIALVVAQFIAYLWGGYTAGRMGRGAGFLNGLLVPILAILVAVIVGAVAAGLGAEVNLNAPFQESQLPIADSNVVDFGTGVAIGSLIAMFLGGILGGLLGARWHAKLERRVAEEVVATEDARGDTVIDDERGVQERRRLAADAEARRTEQLPPREDPAQPAPVAPRGTVAGQEPATTAPPAPAPAEEKPSLKDRITGRG